MEHKPGPRGRRAPAKPKADEPLIEDELPDLLSDVEEDAKEDAEADFLDEDEQDFAEDEDEDRSPESPTFDPPTDPKISAPAGGRKPEAAAPLGDRAAHLAEELPVQVVAVLGKKTFALRELLALQRGQILDLGQEISTVVDLVANGKLIAKGELVEVEGKLGVRILKMVT
ncbi:MAG: FliM/FliN family flagellar motor switch protein [Deltaproteobacteria bacterium]|nr:FliM/FliN family flagellar motor switch protein [Deltaproteobacteria bacterium]